MIIDLIMVASFSTCNKIRVVEVPCFDFAEFQAMQERPQSPQEQIANGVSHGLGLLAALAGFPVLVLAANRQGGAAEIVAASVFATTRLLLYLASTLFHALPAGRAKRVSRSSIRAAGLPRER